MCIFSSTIRITINSQFYSLQTCKYILMLYLHLYLQCAINIYDGIEQYFKNQEM